MIKFNLNIPQETVHLIMNAGTPLDVVNLKGLQRHLERAELHYNQLKLDIERIKCQTKNT